MENVNGNLPANIMNAATALAQSARTAGASTSSDAYMKFSKFGEWIYGSENIAVEEGSVGPVNPLGFMHGYVAWGTKPHGTSGQNVGEMMVPATHPMPEEALLPQVKGEWAKCVGIQLYCTTGEDEGLQAMFKTNSYGGRKAYAALLQTVVARITTGAPDCMPLVQLKSDSYEHKEYGKIFTPVIEIVGWASHSEERTPTAKAAVERPRPYEDAPRKVEEPPVTQPAPEEAPRRRRRRAE